MSGPVALVTGASAGIGDAFARLLAARGHDLVLVARDRARLEAAAERLRGRHGVAAEVLAADLTELDQLAAVETRLAATERPVELLVNDAGFGTSGRFDRADRETEDREVRLNVVAVLRLTHAALAGMVARGRGGVLNVSSIAGLQPTPGNATYAATKAFVTSFSESLHEELRGTGVTVTALCPGFTRTEFQERNGFDPDRVPRFLWSTADDVAAAGLDGLARGRAVVVPGALYKVAAALTSVAPHALSRRVAGVVVRHSE